MKLKQLLISTASIAALAVVPMSIVSCGNNNNNSVDQLPPANGGDNNNQQPGTGDNNNSTPGNGDNNNQQPGTGDNDTQKPAIEYINIEDRNGMLENILTNTYIASEFIKQVLKNPPIGEVTYAQWNRGLTSIVPGNTSYYTDGGFHYYNLKNLTFTITAGKVALYYSVNNESQRHTISASGSWTVSVELNFKSTTKIENL